MQFPPSSGHHRQPGICRKRAQGGGDPALFNLAIAIDALHELCRAQPSQPGIAGAGGGERPCHVQLNHLGSQGNRAFGATVG